MSELVKQVNVPKELDEVLGAVVDMVIAAKQGNFNALGALGKFVSLLGDLAAIPAEIQLEPAECAAAASLQMIRLVQALSGPKA